MRTCSENFCERKHYAKGYCYGHYVRLWRGKDPSGRLGAAKRSGENVCGKERCPAAMRMRGHIHYLKNKDVYIERAINQNPEDLNRYKSKWKSRNPAKVRADTLARKRGLKQATPPWLTPEHWQQMNAIYDEAREKGMHVDHIVPLRGRIVCGLHVPWNLRILPPEENMSRPRRWTW